MMKFEIVPVVTKSDTKRFVKSQWNFYKNDPNFVPPLIMDRMEILSKKKNPFYKHGDIQMYLAVSGKEVVGRIAAITNDNHNKTHNDKVGFFGFFECVDDQEVANALFDVAGKWLRDKGMTVVRGPENPSMNDEIGLLVEGFDGPPKIMMTYNPQYYEKLVLNAGFKLAQNLLAFVVTYEEFASEKLRRMQSILRERNKLTIREVDFKDKTQFAKDVASMKEIYNAAWMPNWGFVRWTDEEFDKTADNLKLIAWPELSLIAECDGKIAAMAIALPDINQCLIHNKKGGLIGGIWHLLTKKKKINAMRIIALGLKPEFQKTGIDAVLYNELGERGHKAGMIEGEASWVLECNEMMVRQFSGTMSGDIYRRYRLYDKDL